MIWHGKLLLVTLNFVLHTLSAVVVSCSSLIQIRNWRTSVEMVLLAHGRAGNWEGGREASSYKVGHGQKGLKGLRGSTADVNNKLAWRTQHDCLEACL